MPDMNNNGTPTPQSRITLKKILVIVLIAISILLPTILAVISLSNADNNKNKDSLKIHTVILCDESGKEIAHENDGSREHGDSSLISIFNTINDNMIPSEKISGNVVTEAPITATLISKAKTSVLTCYFSFTEGSSFCIDENGNYYRIPAEDSERFLISEFSEILYDESRAPVLSSADGDIIKPKAVNWSYQNIQNDHITAKLNDITDSTVTYHVTGNISLVYDTAPDSCQVNIYNDTESVFSGTMEDLASLKLDSSTLLTVKISSSWEQKNGVRSFGNIDYEFQVIIHKRAEFYLDKTVLSTGEFAILRATNISDISKLSFTCDDVSYEPQFSLVGETAYAVVPCPSVLSEDEKYTFTASYGVSSQTFTVTATEQAAVDQAALNKLFRQSSLYKEAIDYSDTMFFNGCVFDVSKYGFSISESFGERNNESPTFSTKFTVQNKFGASVRAVCAGKVIYVGSSEAQGAYVIIDAGLGMRFCYSRLSTTEVSVGKYVAVGDTLGKTGPLSLGCEGFALTVSFRDTVIDYEKTIKETQIGKAF